MAWLVNKIGEYYSGEILKINKNYLRPSKLIIEQKLILETIRKLSIK
jgi:hypothetical protein